jgi:hypothetical protein
VWALVPQEDDAIAERARFCELVAVLCFSDGAQE